MCVCAVVEERSSSHVSSHLNCFPRLIHYVSCVAAEHGFCTVPNECLCEEGYGGENCDMDLDVCGHQQPCATGATCTSTGPDQYVCTCPTGFTGTNCDMETDECSPNPCQNGAICVVGLLFLSLSFYLSLFLFFSVSFSVCLSLSLSVCLSLFSGCTFSLIISGHTSFIIFFSGSLQ